MLRTNGGALGAQTPAGVLGGKEVNEAIGALATRTERDASVLKARDPEAFRSATASVNALYGGFKTAYGAEADTRWESFLTDARANGYAAAASRLPGGDDTKDLRGAAGTLDMYKTAGKGEFLNAALDVQAVGQFREQNPTTPTTTRQLPAAPTQTTAPTTPTPPAQTAPTM